MRKVAKYLFLISGFICLSVFFGCRTLSTRADLPSSGPVDGLLFYYLPIGKITITGKAPPISAPTATPTTTPTATLKPENEQTEQDDGGLADQTVNLTAKGTRSTPPSDGEGDQSGPSSPNTIAGAKASMTITAEVEADEQAGAYYMEPTANYLYEDEVQVSTKKHLLSSGKVTTEDKTADIVGAVASLAASVSKQFVGRAAPEAEPEPFTFSFHPHNACEVSRVVKELRKRNIILNIRANGDDVTKEGSVVHTLSDKEKDKLNHDARLTEKEGSPGLLFRPAASYVISVKYTVSGRKAIDYKQQFILPDPTKLYVMRYERMPFVKKVRDIGFTDGMLTEFHQKVPSPILGFLGIPKAILQAIVPIPGAADPSGSASASGTGAPQN